MKQTLRLLLGQAGTSLKSRAELQLENLALHHQVSVVPGSPPGGPRFQCAAETSPFSCAVASTESVNNSNDSGMPLRVWRLP